MQCINSSALHILDTIKSGKFLLEQEEEAGADDDCYMPSIMENTQLSS
jgi:hypothetical protein